MPLEEGVPGILKCLLALEKQVKEYKHRLHQLTMNNESILESIYNNEINIAFNNQYSRRENIEFINIPEKIKQSQLEDTVIKILNCMGVNVSSYNIVGVHRLGKPRDNKTRNVIVRFLNRKHAIDVLRNKRELPKARTIGYNNLYVIENLCRTNKKIVDRCYQLNKSGDIKSLWSFNGMINIKFTDNRYERPTKIIHFDDIDFLFDDDSFYDSE